VNISQPKLRSEKCDDDDDDNNNNKIYGKRKHFIPSQTVSLDGERQLVGVKR